MALKFGSKSGTGYTRSTFPMHSGTSSHSSALKSHIPEKPWEGHMSEEEYNKQLENVETKKVRGKIKFDPHTDQIIDESTKPSTKITVTGGGKQYIGKDDARKEIQSGHESYIDPSISKENVALNPEDVKLANKYKNLMTKKASTEKKLTEQISTGGIKGRKLTKRVDKTQKKFDKLDKELTSLTDAYDEISKMSKGQIGDEFREKKLADLDKKIKKLTKKHGRVENRLDRRKDKKWGHEQDIKEGKKVIKGNLLTRAKSNWQNVEARRQRAVINMTDAERAAYRRNNAKNIAAIASSQRTTGSMERYKRSTIHPDNRKLTHNQFANYMDTYKKRREQIMAQKTDFSKTVTPTGGE